MQRHFIVRISIAMLVVGLLASCNGKIKSEYIAGCKSGGGTKELCSCIYDGLEDKYGSDGIRGITRGVIPPDYTRVSAIVSAQCVGMDPDEALHRLGIGDTPRSSPAEGLPTPPSNEGYLPPAADGSDAASQRHDVPVEQTSIDNVPGESAGMGNMRAAPSEPNQSGATPSFNCENASSNVEKMICGSADLSTLDFNISEAYKAALNCSSAPDNIKGEQRFWVQNSRAKCQDDQCLSSTMQERLNGLLAICR